MSNGYTTTVFPDGVTNALIGSALQTYSAPDPTQLHTYYNDFDVFTAGDWTGTATGSVTNSIIAGDGGWLSMANSAASADLDSLQVKAATFAIVAGQDCWFKARFKVSNATNANLLIGLIQTTTTPLTVTDGVYFRKNAASTTLNALTTKTSTSTTLAVGTMANDTFINVGFHYTNNSIQIYFNNNRIGSMATTNLPTAALNLTMAVSNGTAAANTLTTDYILASTFRPSTAL